MELRQSAPDLQSARRQRVDTISLLTTAAAAFGNSAVGEVAKRSIGDAWDGLKRAIQHKLGPSSEVPALLDRLRTNPGSVEGGVLSGRLASANLDTHPKIVAALNRLSDILARLGLGTPST